MTSPRRRLAFVSPLPPPQGGISVWTSKVIDSPLERRFDIRVVNSSPSIVDVVGAESRFRASRVLDAVRVLAHQLRVMVRFRPDVVHVNTSYHWALVRDGLSIWIAWAFGARTLLHFRGGDFRESVEAAPRMYRAFARSTLRRADRLIALTRDTQAYLGELVGVEKVRYLPNFAGAGLFGDAPRAQASPGPVHVLFVGWITQAKGVGELLDAAESLPDVRFTLIGAHQPPFSDEALRRCERLSDRVKILSPLPHDQVIELYETADIFALPTYREGFPNVVLEAMAAGLAIVATPVGAIPEIVRDGVEALLVAPRDSEALTRALRRLADDAELRQQLGSRARARVEEAYSFETVIAEMEQIYDDLLTD